MGEGVGERVKARWNARYVRAYGAGVTPLSLLPARHSAFCILHSLPATPNLLLTEVHVISIILTNCMYERFWVFLFACENACFCMGKGVYSTHAGYEQQACPDDGVFVVFPDFAGSHMTIVCGGICRTMAEFVWWCCAI